MLNDLIVKCAVLCPSDAPILDSLPLFVSVSARNRFRLSLIAPRLTEDVHRIPMWLLNCYLRYIRGRWVQTLRVQRRPTAGLPRRPTPAAPFFERLRTGHEGVRRSGRRRGARA